MEFAVVVKEFYQYSEKSLLWYHYTHVCMDYILILKSIRSSYKIVNEAYLLGHYLAKC